MELKDLKAGDYVFVSWGMGIDRLSKITKVTKNEIFVEEIRFHKENGNEICKCSIKRRIYIPTSLQIEKHKEDARRTALATAILHFGRHGIMNAPIAQIEALEKALNLKG